MGRREQLAAELAMVELEERLVAYKDDPAISADSDEYKQVKEELRQARYTFRSLRDGNPAEESLADATVRPEPVTATAGVKKRGGTG